MGLIMRYQEIIEAMDLQKQQIDAQKQNAARQLQAAKRAKEQAKAADLRLKLQRSQQTLTKINQQKPS